MKRIDWDKHKQDIDTALLSVYEHMDKIFHKNHELYELYQEYRAEGTKKERLIEIHSLLVKSEEDNHGRTR